MTDLHPEAVEHIRAVCDEVWLMEHKPENEVIDPTLNVALNEATFDFCKRRWGSKLLPHGGTYGEIVERVKHSVKKVFRELYGQQVVGINVEEKIIGRRLLRYMTNMQMEMEVEANIKSIYCVKEANAIKGLADSMKVMILSAAMDIMTVSEGHKKGMKILETSKIIGSMMTREIGDFKSLVKGEEDKANIDLKKQDVAREKKGSFGEETDSDTPEDETDSDDSDGDKESDKEAPNVV